MSMIITAPEKLAEVITIWWLLRVGGCERSVYGLGPYSSISASDEGDCVLLVSQAGVFR